MLGSFPVSELWICVWDTQSFVFPTGSLSLSLSLFLSSQPRQSVVFSWRAFNITTLTVWHWSISTCPFSTAVRELRTKTLGMVRMMNLEAPVFQEQTARSVAPTTGSSRSIYSCDPLFYR